MSIFLTAWPSLTETEGQSANISCDDLLRWIRTPVVSDDKDSLPGFSLARFTNDKRAAANVEGVSAIVLDDDASGLDVEAVAARWSEFSGVVFSSFSSTAEHPRTRTILFTSRDMTAAEHARVWAHLRDLARRRGLTLDEQTKDPSRLWFVPAVHPDRVFAYAELEGAALDVDAVLAQVPTSTERVAAPNASAPAAPGVERPHAKAAAAIIGTSWPAAGERMAARLALYGACYHSRLAQADAVAFAQAVHAHVPDRGDATDSLLVAEVGNTYRRGAAGEPVAGWPKLAEHVGAAVVSAARGLIAPDADEQAEILELLETPMPKAANDTNVPDAAKRPKALEFRFGGWDGAGGRRAETWRGLLRERG